MFTRLKLAWKILQQESTTKFKNNLHIEKYDGQFFGESLARKACEFSLGNALMFSLGYFGKKKGLFVRSTFANMTENSFTKGGDWANNPDLSPCDFGLTHPLTSMDTLRKDYQKIGKIFGETFLAQMTKEEKNNLQAQHRRTPSIEAVCEIAIANKKFNANNPEHVKELEKLVS